MRRVALLLALAALLAPAAAQASTASTDGVTITITGGPESSDITLGTGLFSTGIRDAAGITAGPGCEQSDLTSVSCGQLFGRVVNADLGDGNDKIGALAGSLGTVRGGPGNDELNGDGADNRLYGDAGIDVLYGGNANDLLDGGPGTDQLYGDGFYVDAGGADTLLSRDGERDEVSCGAGYDTVTGDTLDQIYVECESVDLGATSTATTPLPKLLPTMKVTEAKTEIGRVLKLRYAAWRRGTKRRYGSSRRISRTSVKFPAVSVRYRGRRYRGWGTTKFIWKNDEVYFSTRVVLRRG